MRHARLCHALPCPHDPHLKHAFVCVLPQVIQMLPFITRDTASVATAFVETDTSSPSSGSVAIRTPPHCNARIAVTTSATFLAAVLGTIAID